MGKTKIVEDVQEFVNKCTDSIASFEHDKFGVDLDSEFRDMKIESPIE